MTRPDYTPEQLAYRAPVRTAAVASGPMFFKMRLVRGAAYSAVCVWKSCPTDPDTGETLYERPATWRCKINGQDDAVEAAMIEFDGTTNLPVIKGEPCDEAEYTFILKDHLYHKQYFPDAPQAKPRERIDLNRIPTLF